MIDKKFKDSFAQMESDFKDVDLNEKTFKFAWFLMELCLIDYNTLKFKMSELAASAILIASKTLPHILHLNIFILTPLQLIL